MHDHTYRIALLAVVAVMAACGTAQQDDTIGFASLDSGGSTDGGGTSTDGTVAGDTGADDTVADDTAAAPDSATATDTNTFADTASRSGECPADRCLIAAQCFANGAKNPKNPCEACRVFVDASGWTTDDTNTCDDGDPCTLDDACSGGKCTGGPHTCNDSNPCTADKCVTDAAGRTTGKPTCEHTPVDGAACTDGDLCTTGDVCTAGACKPTSKRVCDDGNSCTVGTCKNPSGCAFTPTNGGDCDDGEGCTVKDICAGGACIAGSPKPCDDGDACTLDGCKHGGSGAGNGACKHKSIAELCKDDSVCTTDSCDKASGCVYGFTTEKCDDLNKCTQDDQCAAGLCTGATVAVDDNNPCTNDACDPSEGVTHVNNTLPCDDGDKCTVDDNCGGGACQFGPQLPCDDNNACTDDGCNAKTGCIVEPNKDKCDDGTKCTKDDHCDNAKCAGTKVVCDDKNACTKDSCDAQKGCLFELIVSNACRPNIDVTYPPRGATIKQTSAKITIKGTVKSGAGPITSFTLNGKPVTVAADGAFSIPYTSVVAGNTLVFKAVDKLGTPRKRVQAFLWSTTYFKPIKSKAKSGMVTPGMAFFMDKNTIDDGNHSLPPNDLATIFELYFKSMDLGALLAANKKPGEPDFTASGINVFIKKVTYGTPKVTLTPVTGAFKMTATIPNLKATLLLTRKKLFGGTAEYDGTMTSTSVAILATIVPTVKAGKIVSETKDVSVTLNGFEMKVSGGLGGIIINAIVGLFKNQIRGILEKEFESAIKNQIGPAVANALNALAVTFNFGIPRLDDPTKKIAIQVVTDVHGTDIRPDGARFDLRAGAYTDKQNHVDNLGVPGRINCGSGTQTLVMPRKNRLELGIADDALNSVLYAAWLGGLLEFPLPASMLGAVDLSKYGVSDLKMTAKALLAPTVSDCNAKSAPKAHIGDFRIDAEMTLLGQKLNVVLWATFVAGVDIKVDKTKGELSIALTEIESIETEINVQQDNLIGSEAAIDKMIGESLVKGLMGTLGGAALGSFPLPAIDLSGTVQGLPKGTAIAIDAQSLVRLSGNSVVLGKLK